VQNSEKESNSIKLRGGRRPGAGRPLGSPNKLTRPLKELAALHTEDCIAVLVQLRDHAEAEQVRLAAANALLDRGHGRPRQEIEWNDEGPVTIIIQGSTPRPVLEVRPALEDHAQEGGGSKGSAIFSSRTS
jgi:hypothetical protein